MTTLTKQQARTNFDSLANLILSAAPSQKAHDFARRVFGQVEERGIEWMAANAEDLCINRFYENDAGSPFPVADNRLFYMGKIQLALTK